MPKTDALPKADPADTGEAPRPPTRPLTPEAERALAEAAERRRQRDSEARNRPVEKGGQAGPDPVRYGDWEKDGIISDF
jgi:hypothetical protein